MEMHLVMNCFLMMAQMMGLMQLKFLYLAIPLNIQGHKNSVFYTINYTRVGH